MLPTELACISTVVKPRRAYLVDVAVRASFGAAVFRSFSVGACRAFLGRVGIGAFLARRAPGLFAVRRINLRPHYPMLKHHFISVHNISCPGVCMEDYTWN